MFLLSGAANMWRSYSKVSTEIVVLFLMELSSVSTAMDIHSFFFPLMRVLNMERKM